MEADTSVPMYTLVNGVSMCEQDLADNLNKSILYFTVNDDVKVKNEEPEETTSYVLQDSGEEQQFDTTLNSTLKILTINDEKFLYIDNVSEDNIESVVPGNLIMSRDLLQLDQKLHDDEEIYETVINTVSEDTQNSTVIDIHPYQMIMFSDIKQPDILCDSQMKFKCLYEGCKKEYISKQYFDAHMVTHTNMLNNRPYSCSFEGCEKNFPTNYLLKSHIRRHTGEKPYVCQVCLKRFKMSGDLQKHTRTHTGRHKFHKDIETALNEQVIIELNASFSYLAMAAYFGRTEVALPGCQGFFMAMHEEEHEHALIFINYILMRGGHPEINNISVESKEEWKDLSKAFATAVEMESSVKEKLEELVELSEKHRDHQLVDFISSGFLHEQNESICSMARLLTRSKMATDKIGEHLFDKHLFDSFVSKKNSMYLRDLPEEKQDHIYK
ncbi:uncharacterized protein LOC115890986 isoform X1 [Sitophilus oryzae]|uniref:Ferritin n=1 Tax=Sitophilus oryzae TaxID=7048 RepID=A0A6J2YVB6_SITOR|nr:uncharacterized protein LOC115890986 isoform X1 [Sitophilus oryzae]